MAAILPGGFGPMNLLFAVYVPDAHRMVPALAMQFLLLAGLAAALIAYACQRHGFMRSLGAILGGGFGGTIAGLWLERHFDTLTDRLIALVELWQFAIFTGAGLVLGAIVLAAVSKTGDLASQK